MRIGHGFDVHRLVSGRKLRLGGVEIPFARGLDGHSDADVLIHSICDALFGAAALGDIGKHFPDSDPAHADQDSRELLRETLTEVNRHGFSVSNLDATIVAEAPRLSGFIFEMINNLAEDLKISSSQINVKATTTEKLGFTGRGEGIAAYAVVLLTTETHR
ncbi:2-C-methyl-D-erythritol 2,4-cyclodiphosphate synthase [Arenicellales bacterium nBUS_48]